MHFYVLDVETTNRSAASICQIGLVEVENRTIINEWCFMIHPEGPFEYFNVRVHGITEERVKDAPDFSHFYDILKSKLTEQFVVQHTNFDQLAIDQSCLRYSKDIIPINWVDSSEMAKTIWPELVDTGYGLKALSDHFRIEINPHDALEDARATAKLTIIALNQINSTIEALHMHQLTVEKSVRYDREKLVYSPNPEGIYFKQQICFTGDMKRSRKKAMEKASELGFRITNNVNFYTDYLVVGGISKKEKKNPKIEKANKLIQQGSNLKIIGEPIFNDLCFS